MKNLIIIMLTSCLGYSQSISKQVIGTAGKTQSNVNLNVSFTVGEPFVGLMTADGNQLGNGYYPSLNLKVLSVEDNILDVQLSVYPNPTSQSLHVSHPEMSFFGITIVDLNGKLLYLGTVNKEEPLDVSAYTQGTYWVIIDNAATKKKNTYKIIKK